MIDTDDLTTRLQQQMRTATADDVAPADLLHRVHRSNTRRRHRTYGVVATVVALSGAAALALPGVGADAPGPARLAAPAAPSVAGQLSVLRADSGQTSLQVQVNGSLRTELIELPGYLRNSGTTPLLLLDLSVPGTSLRGDFPVQTLAPGGERPLTLVRTVDCADEPDLPATLDVRVRIRTADQETSVLLPLPEEVVSNYRNTHACTPQRRALDDAEAQTQES